MEATLAYAGFPSPFPLIFFPAPSPLPPLPLPSSPYPSLNPVSSPAGPDDDDHPQNFHGKPSNGRLARSLAEQQLDKKTGTTDSYNEHRIISFELRT